jgi:hypothetical protein
LLPHLPATALTVIAGRAPPSPDWRADPGWHDLLRVVSLRNLGAEESRRFLRESAVDTALHDRLIKLTMAIRWGCRCSPTSPRMVGRTRSIC